MEHDTLLFWMLSIGVAGVLMTLILAIYGEQTREEVRAIVEALEDRWRPLILTAIFTGMRASELRGLRWQDVDLDRRDIRVHQRADRYNEIGKPKSIAGERTIPATPMVINTLREWKVACPPG